MEASLEKSIVCGNIQCHTNHFTVGTFHQLMANSGSWIRFSREGITDTWQTGIDTDNSYVIRASNPTNVVTVNPNGNVALTGNLDVGVDSSLSKIDAHSNQQGYTAVTELHSQSPWTSKLECISTHPTPWSFIFLKGSIGV